MLRSHAQRCRRVVSFLLAITVLLTALVPASVGAATPDRRFGAVDGHLDAARAREAGLGWTRLLIWWREIQPGGPDDWNWQHIPEDAVNREVAEGREVVGLLISTPAWASEGTRPFNPPNGLYLPIDDPNNTWARFTEAIASRYRGRIDHWIIWNEPDVWDASTGGYTWSGSVEDFYQLQKVAYQSIKRANPNATVTTPGFTYWWDRQYDRPLYFERLLEVAAKDPTAPANNWYFDVAVLQLYNNPMGLYDIPVELRSLMRRFGIDKPIWINETNIAPWDDAKTPLSQDNYRATLREQADYVVQASALALAAGVERFAIYKWIDDPTWAPGLESYGLIRADGTTRPAYDAYRTVMARFSGALGAQLDHRGEWTLVTVERPTEWVSVLWNNTTTPRTVHLEALAPTATVYRADGSAEERAADAGSLQLALAPATHQPVAGRPDITFVGGPVAIVVQPKTRPSAPHATEEAGWVSPTTGQTVFGPWLAFVEQCGGVATLGEPLTGVIHDPRSGQSIQVFERAVLEWHADASGAGQVQRRLLGDLFYPGAEPPAPAPDLPDGTYHYFPWDADAPSGLGHAVADVAPDGHPLPFKSFFDRACGSAMLGYPKAPPRLVDGHWEQHFQAGVLVYEPTTSFAAVDLDPATAPGLDRVHLEPLGRRYLEMLELTP